MSSIDIGSNMIGPNRIRTYDQWIMSPLSKNHKDSKNKDLGKEQPPTVAPAYKQNQKNAENEPEKLPTDLAEIAAVWPELPEHIKAAVKAMIETFIANSK